MNKIRQHILFKNMDTFLFKWIDKFQQTEYYTSILNFLNGMSAEVKTLAGQILSASIFLIPFILLSMFYFLNQDIRDRIDIKSSALDLADTIVKESRDLKDLKFKYVPETDFSNQQMYIPFVSKCIEGIGVDKTDIIVNDFTTSNVSGGDGGSSDIQKTLVDLTLNSFTYPQFKLFLTKYMQQKGTKILGYKIKLNEKTNLLDIQLKIQHLFSSSFSSSGFME